MSPASARKLRSKRSWRWNPRATTPVILLIGDADHARQLNQELALNLPLQHYDGRNDVGRFFITNPLADSLPSDLVEGSPAAARAAIAWLNDGANRCLRQELDALVTAPVNKEAIVRSGQAFVGQTELLSQLAGVDRTAMMLLGQDDHGRWLRVALVTTHLPLKMVAAHVTQAKVELAIELAAQSCRDLGLARARIAVCGLNPHAGEGGQMGDEEQTTIGPPCWRPSDGEWTWSVHSAATRSFTTPCAGITTWLWRCTTIRAWPRCKCVAFDTGVNWTLGLPFIRTSPDHGTAYDIAGQGIANPSSMMAAIRLAKQLARHRWLKFLRERYPPRHLFSFIPTKKAQSKDCAWVNLKLIQGALTQPHRHDDVKERRR